MEPTTLTLHSDFQIGPVDARLFGGFLEHIGRAVYQGVYEPEGPHADEDGFRADVLAALRQLGMTVMRYPGGNFASGYHWADGVGPPDRRPTVLESAWNSTEPNRFGTDEFLRLCRKLSWTPMLTVNLGTGTPEEARNWVEYCNRPVGTRLADLRAANGQSEPHRVKLWCLGNEMDEPWQMGHCPPEQYAVRAQQAARLMKGADPGIELVVCGSCGVGMPTYMEWDRQVLEYVLPRSSAEVKGLPADYVSLHRYVGNAADDTPDYLATGNALDRQIEEMDAAIRYVQAKLRSRQRPYLCFDEWNVWYRNFELNGGGRFAPALLEEIYNLEDALVVAGFLNSFIRHADLVKIANLAQIVNVIAPILTRGEKMLIQSIYYPFEMYSRRRAGVSLRPVVSGPSYEGKTNGPATVIDASAIQNEDLLHVFMVNRSPNEAAEVRIKVADRPPLRLDCGEILTGPDAKAANTFDQPGRVKSRYFTDVKIADGLATATLPPLSLAALTFMLSDPVCLRT